MRRAVLLLMVMGAAVLLATGVALAQAKTPTDKIPGRYIVVLNEDIDEDAGRVASEHGQRYGAQIGFVYRNAIKGYSAAIPDNRVADVQNDPRVAYVERDGVMRAIAQTLPWGIGKVDADVSSTKAGEGTGAVSNVNAYIIDTGVDTAHADLNVVDHVNFAGGRNKDCQGHGTHVAGTVAAEDNTRDVVGVAPGAPLTGVKVLGCNGSGTTSGVIKGVDWVTGNAKKPAIANMSLGGGASTALDDAVKKSADSGVFYALAAGNDGADAYTQSPARTGTHNGVTTTAATDSSDKETSWSNYGKCVDIWAPGASILSTKLSGGTTTKSGTSMASPHVGGTGALYLSANTGSSPATVESQIKTDSASTGTTSKDGAAIKLDYAGKY